MRDLMWRTGDGLRTVRENAERWLFGDRRAQVGLALCRILVGAAVFLMLATNFGERSLWVGPGSVWADPVRSASSFPELVLVRDASNLVVTVIYIVTLVAALALTFGFLTKLANVVTLVGFIALVGQNPMVGSASDNAIRLSLLWLVLTQSGMRCSIDARRRESRELAEEPGRRTFDSSEVLPTWLGTSLHNIGLLGLVVQTVLIYTTAGFDKVSRAVWRSGEALYYTTQLPEFRPFPAISDAVSASTVLLAVLTYSVLLVQLFFAPLMLHRVSRIVAVVAAVLANAFFAIVFGAPLGAMAITGVTLLLMPDDILDGFVDRIASFWDPIGAILDEIWYWFLDKVDALWFNVTDWIKFTIFRR